MFRKINQTKMLIMPLAMLLLSSTIVMAISSSMSPSAAYAITFGDTKKLSNVDGNSVNPLIEASGQNVYTVWENFGKDVGRTLFKGSSDGGDNFHGTVDLSKGITNNGVPNPLNQQIVKEGNNVYVVWNENGDVFLKRSTDGGASFKSAINLSHDDRFSIFPDIAVVDNNVYVVWSNGIPADEPDQKSQLFFKRSTDGGASFGSVKKLPHVEESLHPSMTASGNNVYIAFTGGSEDNEKVFFTKSTNEGGSFSDAIGINNNFENSANVGIKSKGNNVYVVWQDDSKSETHVFFKRSTDAGKSFGSVRDFGSGNGIQMDIISNNVYVVWHDGDGGGISFKASKDDGASFGSTKKLSNTGDGPQISSSGTAVRVVWAGDDTSGSSDIFFRASSNEGNSFGSLKNLSNDDDNSNSPQIISSGGKVYVVWESLQNDKSDIFFKKGID